MSGGGSDPGGVWTLRRWQAEALPVVIAALRARRRPVVSAFMGSGKSVFLAELCAQARIDPGRGIIVAAPRAGLVEQLAATLGRRMPGRVGRWYEAAKEGGAPVVVTTYQSLPTLIEAWRGAGRSPCLAVCDEVHGTEADTVRASVAALDALAGRPVARVGLTATPFRSRSRESLSLWDEAVYRYGWRDGIADGVIVPWRVVRWGGEGEAAEVDRICVEMLQREGVFPTLASARTIRDAEAFAALLSGSDLPAAAVHSGLSAREVAGRIEALRCGRLRVLVHVAMLAEGADFPWLRGLMLRRRVGARVRFVQEVGRVLRACEGKAEGVVFDPFDLMGELGLTHDEAIGEAMEAEEGTGTGGGGGEGKPPEAVAVLSLSDWLAEVGAALWRHGLEVGRPGRWRREAATPGQIRAAQGMAWALTWGRGPKAEAVRKRLREWIRAGRVRTKGDASDLIALLRWLADRSASARELRRGGAFIEAQVSYRWPVVTLPEEVPTLED